jgi:hypothetical protein
MVCGGQFGEPRGIKQLAGVRLLAFHSKKNLERGGAGG